MIYAIAAVVAVTTGLLLVWSTLARRIFAANYLPDAYCYLGKPGLVWTHVGADSLIALAYFMISITLVYLVWRGRRDIPFQRMFLSFGLFIVACGTTHLLEVITVWIPVYVFSGAVKLFTALVSMATALLLPFTVPRVLSLVRAEKASEAAQRDLVLANDRLRLAMESST